MLDGGTPETHGDHKHFISGQTWMAQHHVSHVARGGQQENNGEFQWANSPDVIHLLSHPQTWLVFCFSQHLHCLTMPSDKHSRKLSSGTASPPNILSAKCCSWKDSGESHGTH